MHVTHILVVLLNIIILKRSGVDFQTTVYFPSCLSVYDSSSIRHVAGVLEGMFVMELKAKCRLSTVRKKRENLEAKTQVFQKTFHFKARTEENAILLVRIKNSYLTVLFLICVFFAPSNEMIIISMTAKKKRTNPEQIK